MADICLEVATILLRKCWEYLTQVSLQSRKETSEFESKILSFIWYFDNLLSDTIGMEIFLADTLSDEFVSGYDEHTTSTVSVIVLTEDTNREYSDVDNLSLDIANSDSVSDMILPEHEEERKNREDKVFQCDDERTESDCEETKATPTLECHDNKKYCNHRECTDNIDDLYLAVVVQIVFCMFLIGGVIVLREHRVLHA